ncbi:hypothetical protein D9613_010887 [Agrocybe pediades]|uniref:SHSP domain-containing protein n=1 Tax=Agrocybe pediades TaxID=84607 RepID=A0A8H4QMU5_9AGAR|nr:hypothetical protein D9613_010887 [Agrocybe pediades]
MSNVFFYEPLYDIDRLVEQAFLPPQGAQNPRHGRELAHRGDRSFDGAVRSFKPRMDLHEDKGQNIVTATFEFPGVAKENINIDVHNRRLTVSAETKQSEEHDEAGYAVRERRFGRFSRTLQLPQGVRDDEIKASMENGLLTITFPKSIPEQAPKKITIS